METLDNTCISDRSFPYVERKEPARLFFTKSRYKIKYVCLKPIDCGLVKLVAGCLVFYGEVTVQVV
jgi:hypothetical protein